MCDKIESENYKWKFGSVESVDLIQGEHTKPCQGLGFLQCNHANYHIVGRLWWVKLAHFEV